MEEKEEQYIVARYYSGYTERKTVIDKLKFWKEFRFARKFAIVTKRGIYRTMKASGQEARETKEMAQSFFKLLESKLDLSNRKEPPTPEEVKAAIEQLKDVGRFSFFATISIIPGGGVSLIGLELLAHKFGLKNFTFLPSAFRKKDAETPTNSSS